MDWLAVIDKSSQVITKITQDQPKYVSRALRKDFLDEYKHVSKTPKCLLHNIYKILVGDASSSNCLAEKEVDERVSKALIDLDDSHIA